MNFKQLLVFIYSSVLFSTTVFSQDFDAFINSAIDETDITHRLPPISELQEQAIKSSPMLKYFDAQIGRNRERVKENKREWMQHMGFDGSARYGLFDNLVISEGTVSNAATNYSEEQSRYQVGVFVKIPISAIFDKSNVDYYRQEVEMVKYLRENNIRELRQTVIIQYNKVIKAHRLFLLRNRMCESYKVQKQRAYKDYINGKINLAEYARLTEMLTKATIELENEKVDFITALHILQEVVGSPINLKDF